MANLTALLLVQFIVAYFSSSESQLLEIICIDAVNGSNGDDCMESSSCCQTLTYVAESLTREQHARRFSLQIQTNITLSGAAEFRDMTYLRIVGEQSTFLTCDNIGGASTGGLYFENVKNLWIEHLTLDNCATLQNSTSANLENRNISVKFPSSLYIVGCTNVTLTAIIIRNAPGTGLVIYDTNGVVNVTNSQFINNTLTENSSFSGGGGVYVEFSYCSSQNERKCNMINQSKYQFNNCTYSGNKAHLQNPEKTTFVKGKKNDFQAFGRGGGLCINIRGLSGNNTFVITNCIFEDNTAVWGGGLYALLRDKAKNNSIHIHSSTFTRNRCIVGGGGVKVGFLSYNFTESTALSYNKFEISMSIFIRNTAEEYGGGVHFVSSREYSKTNTTNTIRFTKCEWLENKALSASAIDVSPGIWDSLSNGVLPSPVFIDCTFINNLVQQNTMKLTEGIAQIVSRNGAFLVTHFNIEFKGVTQFIGNNGSALYLVTSRVVLHSYSQLMFTNNSGISGGAIVMMAFSVIVINSNTMLSFVGNRAKHRGGAIFAKAVNVHEHISSRSCFIQYIEDKHSLRGRNITIFISKNEADTNGGQLIYATSLTACFHQCKAGETSVSRMTFGCIGEVFHEDNDYELNRYSVATSYYKFVINDTLLHQLKPIIPGTKLQVPIMGMDELNHTRHRLNYYASVTPSSRNVSLDSHSKHISHDRVKLRGQPHGQGTLLLRKDNLAASIDIKLTDCPPGYAMEDNVCKCKSSEYFGIWNCSLAVSTMYTSVIEGYWVGKCHNGDVCTAVCPRWYCHYLRDGKKSDYLLPTNFSDLNDFICGPTRTGILCGQCRTNYTLHYHSYDHKCGETTFCSIGILLYFISELFPLTVIFLLIMFLNINFTSGVVNGFILFAQVIDTLDVTANNVIRVPPAISALSASYQFFYRILNIDFFSNDKLSFCLWKNASGLDTMAIKYVTITYALGLILGTIAILNTRICRKCNRWWKPRMLKKTILHGLTAFFVISYWQCARISTHLLCPSYLYSRGPVQQETVVFRDGNMRFFQGEHLKYAIPALFFLSTLVIMPPILLIFYPLCFKILAVFGLGESKFANAISRLIPMELLDSSKTSIDLFRDST